MQPRPCFRSNTATLRKQKPERLRVYIHVKNTMCRLVFVGVGQVDLLCDHLRENRSTQNGCMAFIFRLIRKDMLSKQSVHE